MGYAVGSRIALDMRRKAAGVVAIGERGIPRSTAGKSFCSAISPWSRRVAMVSRSVSLAISASFTASSRACSAKSRSDRSWLVMIRFLQKSGQFADGDVAGRSVFGVLGDSTPVFVGNLGVVSPVTTVTTSESTGRLTANGSRLDGLPDSIPGLHEVVEFGVSELGCLVFESSRATLKFAGCC